MGQTSIGIDIGPRMVRAVALAPASKGERLEGHVARLVASASVARQTQDGHDKPLPAVLEEIRALLGVRGTTAVHLADVKVLFRYLATLPLPPERTAKVLRLELAANASDDGDLAADAWTVPITGDEAIHGCAVAAPTDLYGGFIDLQAGGWGNARIAVGPVAAFNATLPAAPARGEALHLLIDIGPTSTALTLFGEDRLMACRTIGMGADAFNEALRTDTNAPSPVPLVDQRDALALDDLVLDTPAGSETPLFLDDTGPGQSLPMSDLAAPGQATIAVAQARLGPDATRIAEQLAAQIASSVLWFRQQLKVKAIDLRGIHLVGTAIPGLDAYLTRRFSCPATPFSPFVHVAGTPPPEPGAWTVAVGLAMPSQGYARKAVVLDLRPESLVLQEAKRRHITPPLVAAALVLLAALPAGWTLWRHQAAQEEALAAWTTYAADHGRLTSELAQAEAERKALETDLRAIAGRIASGENLLLAIRAMKEQAPKSKELWVTSMTTDRVVADETKTSKTATTATPVDTAIDRGAILVDARIKFDAAPTGTQRLQFGNDYIAAIEAWRPAPGASALFSAIRMEQFEPDAEAGRGGKGEGTVFRFRVRFVFRPTDLSQMTTAQEKAP